MTFNKQILQPKIKISYTSTLKAEIASQKKSNV